MRRYPETVAPAPGRKRHFPAPSVRFAGNGRQKREEEAEEEEEEEEEFAEAMGEIMSLPVGEG